MRISKLAAMSGIVLAALATSANALDITLSSDGSVVTTTGSPTIYNLGTASNTSALYDGSGTTIAPEFLTSGFADGQLQLGFTTGSGLTNLGANGPVLKWNGTSFVNAPTVYVEGEMTSDPSGVSNPITTNGVPGSFFLGSTPSTTFGAVGSPLLVGATFNNFMLLLESSTDNTYAGPGNGVYLVLLQPTLVGGSLNSTPFGLLVGVGDSPVDMSGAQAFADEFITPEPASFALLTIGSVLMLRRNRKVA